MPGLQLRVSSGAPSSEKIKKRSRGSVLFFGKAAHSTDSPSSTNLSRQLPPVYRLDNSSFLDLFQGETHPSPTQVPKCQRASTMPRLSMWPDESSLRVVSNSYVSPVSPASSPTPDNHPWSPDDAFVNVQQQPTDAVIHGPAAARSPSASSRSSGAPNGGPYFSSSASQSSQSSLDDGNALPDSNSTRDAHPKYLVETIERACDLEVVQKSPKRSLGSRVFPEAMSRNKPLPSEPLVDIASPLFEIACPAARASPRKRCSAWEVIRGDKARPRRSSSLSLKGRPNLPQLSTLSRGERLGLALTLHAQGKKIPSIVRHELPAQATEFGEQSPESGNNSPISKLIAELENSCNSRPESLHNKDSTVSKGEMRISGHATPHLASKAERDTYNLRSQSAEKIILNILSLLDIHDLLSATRINRGFHSVFKEHELSLIKSAIFNTCPAAWEYLEEPGIGSNVPARYLESYKGVTQLIKSLRTTLLIRSDALLRPETISGLIRADKEVSKKIDQAFWRISTFCEIFGHRSCRQDNTQAQIDWLRGDRPSQTPNSTTLSSKSKRPLSSAELVDISEIWTCLGSLFQSFYHQASEARDAGLFERCMVNETYTEDFYIKQWVCHVMTFGLSAIVELSSCSFDDARMFGWTRWSPAVGTHQEPPFLADAVASVYQLRLLEEAEAKANKVTLPRKASGRTRSSRKRHTAHGDGLRIQTQNLPRKAVGSPTRKSSLTQTHRASLPPPSRPDSFSPILEGPHPPKAAAPQQATRRRSAATPTITASMFQTLSLQPGASTQIGPTLFPSTFSSPRVALNSKEPRPITPLSSIQSTPIALTRPERVPPRVPNMALSPEQPIKAAPTPPVQSNLAVVSPIVDPRKTAMDLLVNEMGFPPAAVGNALASCNAEPNFNLETVIAMLVSASSQPHTNAAVNVAVKHSQPTELDSSPSHAMPYPRRQTRRLSQEAGQLPKKKQERSAFSAQTMLAGSAETNKSKAQRRHSKIKAFEMLGVIPGRRMSTLVR